MEPLTYILIAIGLIAGVAAGWFVRHNFLNRRLAQSQLQLEELRALQLNVEHELSSLRQKLIHHSTEQENLSTKVEKAQSLNTEKMKAYEDLKSRFDLIAEDNEALQEQITYLESERISYQQYREQTQNKIDALTKQNQALSMDLDELRRKTPRESVIRHEPGGIPRVRRVDPREWRELKESHAKESVPQKDETSRLEPRPAKSTDRFSSRDAGEPEPVSTPPSIKSPEPDDDIDVWNGDDDDAQDFERGTDPGVFPKPVKDEDNFEPEFEPEPISEPEMEPAPEPEPAKPSEPVKEPGLEPAPERMQEPESEPVFTHEPAPDQMQTVSWKAGRIPVLSDAEDDKETRDADAPFMQTTQGPVTAEEPRSESESPPPPEPRPAPSREPVDAAEKAVEPAEDKDGPKTPAQKRKKLRKKKRPSTVRVDITSSDIIDSFKRELGLPDK